MNKKLVVGFFLLLILYVVLLFVTPLIRFKPWFTWWKDHQPSQDSQKEAQACMPLALLAYEDTASIFFWIASLFLIHENQKLQYDWQATFLLRIMERYAVDVVPNGFLTPYCMCSSVAPIKGDDYYDAHPNVPVRAGSWPEMHYWPADAPADVKKQYTSSMLWKGVLSSWGAEQGPDGNFKVDPDTWNSVKSNFLSQKYGIPGNSNLVESFIMGGPEDPEGNPWFEDALPALLGIENYAGAGGWVGLVRGGGDWGSFGLFGLESYVWAKNASDLKPRGSPVKSCGGAGVASGVLQGINTAAMGAMLVTEAAFPFNLIIPGVLGIVGGFLGAKQYKC